jgi:hypothetical protein
VFVQQEPTIVDCSNPPDESLPDPAADGVGGGFAADADNGGQQSHTLNPGGTTDPRGTTDSVLSEAKNDTGNAGDSSAPKTTQPTDRWEIPDDGMAPQVNHHTPPPTDLPQGTTPNQSDSREISAFAAPKHSASKNFWDDQRLPAGLVSTIVHTILLIVLALLTLERSPRGDRAFVATLGEASSEIRLESIDTNQNDVNDENLTSLETVQIDLSKIMVPERAIVPEQPGSAASLSTLPSLNLTPPQVSMTAMRLQGKAGLGKRTPKGRLEMGQKYGATQESERAVELALAYLAAHQRNDGSWSFDLNLAPCNGQCKHSKLPNSGSATPVTGATGLALLAFLGAGHTHHQAGPYQETVRRGIYYLRSIASEVEAGYDWQRGSMYGHGIALMALEEALCMTREGKQYDSDLLDLVQQGAAFSCVAQHENGSWGYVPGRPGDVTITGWQVLSLIGAQKGGAALHTNTLPDAKSYLMTMCEGRSFWFGYNTPVGEPTTTAIGLTLMLFLGQSPYETPFAKSLDRIAQMGPSPNNIYHNYYASLALHHSRHPLWETWNKQLRDYLVQEQETRGHMTGSWHFDEKWGNVGGRLYTTALCAMTLEVYYRFMPLYADDDSFPL